jgi:CRISPR-associated endonuclease/helicase Cas3
LLDRLRGNASVLGEIRPVLPKELLNVSTPKLPGRLAVTQSNSRQLKRSLEFWTRMLFSALVDADFLATERFYTPDRPGARARTATLAELRRLLEERLQTFEADTDVKRLRGYVLDRCLHAAALPPGMFSLTVPTGGGKTLSSMAFALRHAEKHGMRRIIAAIPFTTIIEQNAAVYRGIFGGEAVVEHHSALDEETLESQYGEQELRRRLAAENWDAPIVVTTNVQLFESLFANRPSRCRKLHNIAKSVLILDEVQTLPAGFLRPVLDGLTELASNYGCTVLLSTATQPALTKRAALPDGLDGVREIIPDASDLAARLQRIETSWPSPGDPPITWEALAETVAREPQALVIVHRRRDALELARLLKPVGRHHLSALMCPVHRLEVLARIRDLLSAHQPCRLVTTQLIEAGVDIDFPVVFRALAGLDSLVQAAGRCNREGGLRGNDGAPRFGRFRVFRAPTSPPPGILRRGLEVMEAMLRGRAEIPALGDPDWTDEYFRRLYATVDLDKKAIQLARSELDFATVAEEFQLIEDGSWPVVVPWNDSEARLAAHRDWPTRQSRRALQPYTVQVYRHDLDALRQQGAAEEVAPGLFELTLPYRHLYDRDLGLILGAATADPEMLMA